MWQVVQRGSYPLVDMRATDVPADDRAARSSRATTSRTSVPTRRLCSTALGTAKMANATTTDTAPDNDDAHGDAAAAAYMALYEPDELVQREGEEHRNGEPGQRVRYRTHIHDDDHGDEADGDGQNQRPGVHVDSDAAGARRRGVRTGPPAQRGQHVRRRRCGREVRARSCSAATRNVTKTRSTNAPDQRSSSIPAMAATSERSGPTVTVGRWISILARTISPATAIVTRPATAATPSAVPWPNAKRADGERRDAIPMRSTIAHSPIHRPITPAPGTPHTPAMPPAATPTTAVSRTVRRMYAPPRRYAARAAAPAADCHSAGNDVGERAEHRRASRDHERAQRRDEQQQPNLRRAACRARRSEQEPGWDAVDVGPQAANHVALDEEAPQRVCGANVCCNCPRRSGTACAARRVGAERARLGAQHPRDADVQRGVHHKDREPQPRAWRESQHARPDERGDHRREQRSAMTFRVARNATTMATRAAAATVAHMTAAARC